MSCRETKIRVGNMFSEKNINKFTCISGLYDIKTSWISLYCRRIIEIDFWIWIYLLSGYTNNSMLKRWSGRMVGNNERLVVNMSKFNKAKWGSGSGVDKEWCGFKEAILEWRRKWVGREELFMHSFLLICYYIPFLVHPKDSFSIILI